MFSLAHVHVHVHVSQNAGEGGEKAAKGNLTPPPSSAPMGRCLASISATDRLLSLFDGHLPLVLCALPWLRHSTGVRLSHGHDMHRTRPVLPRVVPTLQAIDGNDEPPSPGRPRSIVPILFPSSASLPYL